MPIPVLNFIALIQTGGVLEIMIKVINLTVT